MVLMEAFQCRLQTKGWLKHVIINTNVTMSATRSDIHKLTNKCSIQSSLCHFFNNNVNSTILAIAPISQGSASILATLLTRICLD